MEFVAVDVETANADLGSICQIGIARFVDGQLADEWATLVNPEDYFDEANTAIHGITDRMVRGKPAFPNLADQVRALLESSVSVCHTHFDRVALERACLDYSLEPINTTWLDSARVARRTWQEVAWRGYGLANVCEIIGHEFRHHDALEDAKAAGQVLLAAMRETGLDLEQWINRVRQPIDPSKSRSQVAFRREGNPEGDLFGEVMVFTGALDIQRNEAADLAASAGCAVAPNVTKRTTILVVGDQDLKRLAGHERSSKHRKAEELITKGHPIRIIRETDFKKLVGFSRNEA